jgi:DNA processing protein
VSDRVARAALSRLSEPGDLRVAAAVAESGAEEVYAAVRAGCDFRGVHPDLAVRLGDLDPQRDLDVAAAKGIRFVCPGDPEWPPALDDLDHAEALNGRGGAPLGLWVRGPARLADACAAAVAVVGSRSATTYGGGVAADLAGRLAGQGVTVISGAAFGIDQSAHRGALAARGLTLAVLACGVDRAYPSAHRSLIDYVAETGAVVSEVPPGCAPTKVRFLSRNRLIAALAQGTVVVEAAVRSGALNTANWTERLHRVVMGVPGPVTSAPSEGVHELIRQGAMLVTRAEDVLELVAPLGTHLTAPPRAPVTAEDLLDAEHKCVLDAVPVCRPAGLTSIARAAGLQERRAAAAVARLAERGLVERLQEGWRKSAAPARPVDVPAGRATRCSEHRG